MRLIAVTIFCPEPPQQTSRLFGLYGLAAATWALTNDRLGCLCVVSIG